MQVKDGATVVATYSYNGMNHRVKKVVGSTTTTSFFNEHWQELESTGGEGTTIYVWGLRYIDDLLYRDKGAERLYSIADPNWNVVAIANTSGTILERMTYNAFGKVNWLDASFGAKTASGYNWNRTFTGQVLDAETGLMLYRNRYYHPILGRFVMRDPIGYDAGDVSLYRYVFNSTIINLDTYGLQMLVMPPIIHPNDIPGLINPPPPWNPPKPTPKACCDGQEYNPDYSCCEDGKVVGKVSIWICNRHIPGTRWVSRLGVPGSRTLRLNHSYVCCDGPDKNCYGKQNYTKKTSPIPNERHDVKGKCEKKRVCPKLKKSKCETPISSCDYSLLNNNCHKWAWEGID